MTSIQQLIAETTNEIEPHLITIDLQSPVQQEIRVQKKDCVFELRTILDNIADKAREAGDKAADLQALESLSESECEDYAQLD